MGRGHAYGYDYFMVYDESDLTWGETVEEQVDNADVAWDDFRSDVGSAFKADAVQGRAYGAPSLREGRILFETRRFWIGVDGSGGNPALFCLPKEYRHVSGVEKEYCIGKEVARGFNKLCQSFPKLFYYPTSAWTSAPYGNRYA